ncbi:MAG: SAM-dependent methyltransferase [Pseudomonadota bacterium]
MPTTSPELNPPEDPDALKTSQALVAALCREAQSSTGGLPFERFMEMALYAPGLGYYVAGTRKFGEGGDFVTAPEISPLFSRCLARQLAQVLAGVSGNAVLELGAGSGVMAADMLAELEVLGTLPDSYRILEVSPELRQRQARTLDRRVPHLADRVAWLDALPDRPLRGAVVANEVLDALPVQPFRLGPGAPEIQVLGCEAGRLSRHWMAASEAHAAAIAERVAASDPGPGYVSEYCPRLGPWVRTLGDVLEAGAVLLVDYGYPRAEYYHPGRDGGTLMCHYRHRAHADTLFLPGLQDITAHVDFTAVAEAGRHAGLEVAGFATQALFLMGCGIDGLVEEAAGRDEADFLKTVEGVKRLTLPTAMGERFKVMALTRDLPLPLMGFSLQDLRNRL